MCAPPPPTPNRPTWTLTNRPAAWLPACHTACAWGTSSQEMTPLPPMLNITCTRRHTMWHRHIIQKLGRCPGYLRAVSRGIWIRSIGPILISGALGPEDMRRYPGHMTPDPCTQPFPRP